MHRHWAFITAICQQFDYWKDESVLAASIDRYQRFMQLKKEQLPPPPPPSPSPHSDQAVMMVTTATEEEEGGDALVPTVDIELVWQAHMSQAKKYDRFCRVLTTGRRIRHSYLAPWYRIALDDHVDSSGCCGTSAARDSAAASAVVKRVYAKTCRLWSQRFQERYANLPPEPPRLSRSKMLKYSLGNLVRRWLWQKKKEKKMLLPADIATPTAIVIGSPIHTAIRSAAERAVLCPHMMATHLLLLPEIIPTCPPSTPPPPPPAEGSEESATAPSTPTEDDEDGRHDGTTTSHLQGRIIAEAVGDNWSP